MGTVKLYDSKKFILWTLIYIVIIGCLYTLNGGNSTVRTVGALFFLGLSVFLPFDELIVMIAVIEPFSIIFKINGGYTVLPYLFIVFLIKGIIKSKTISTKPFIILVITAIISFANSYIRYGAINSVFSFFLLAFAVLWYRNVKDFDKEIVFNSISNLYIASVFLECVLSEILTNIPKLVTVVSAYNIRNIGFSNEWDYGRHIIVAIAFIIYWIIKRKKQLLPAVVLLLFFISRLISTGLYTGLVALAILLLCLPFCFGRTQKERVIYFMLFAVVSVILGVLLYQYVYLPMLSIRGQVGDNGRFEIWSQYIQDFINNPSIMLFGVGGGCIADYAAQVNRVTAHNVIIEKLVEFGLFGFIIFVTMLRGLTHTDDLNFTKNHKMLVLIAFLGTCLTQGVTGNEMIFILIMICFTPKHNIHEGYLIGKEEVGI